MQAVEGRWWRIANLRISYIRSHVARLASERAIHWATPAGLTYLCSCVVVAAADVADVVAVAPGPSCHTRL